MNTSSRILRSLLIAGMAVSMAGCSGMISGDPFKEDVAEDSEGGSLSYSISRRILGTIGGATTDTKKKIDYKPRAPLAVPPTMTMTAPEDRKVATSEMANWPKEQDESKAYLEQRQAEKTFRERNRDDWENPVVPGREVARYRVVGGGQQVDPKDNGQGDQAPQFTQDEADQFAKDVGKTKNRTSGWRGQTAVSDRATGYISDTRRQRHIAIEG